MYTLYILSKSRTVWNNKRIWQTTNTQLYEKLPTLFKEAKESMDLDQTTMIGSALDLDSLEGDSKQNNAAQVRLT